MMRKRGLLFVEVPVNVPFFDVDLMQVVWHGHYVKYLELGRQALLDAMGHGYSIMLSSGYAWPVIDLQLRYMQPAVFGQALIVRADLIEWENQLKINYLIYDAATGTRLTRASSVQVAVCVSTRSMQFQSPAAFCTAVRNALACGQAGLPNEATS